MKPITDQMTLAELAVELKLIGDPDVSVFFRRDQVLVRLLGASLGKGLPGVAIWAAGPNFVAVLTDALERFRKQLMLEIEINLHNAKFESS